MARSTYLRLVPILVMCAALLIACGGSAVFSTDEPSASLDLPPSAVAAVSRVVEGQFHSAALDRDMPYLVLLPPGYEAGAACYPTLYLLHGIGASNREWLGYGVDVAAACLWASGRLQPLLIVLPQGDESYWLNHAAGGPRWGDYVAEDLVAHIDATFRTRAEPTSRAIGGLSMGGHGALQLAFNHPDVFGVAGAHSPTLRPQVEAWGSFAEPATFGRVDPVTLAQQGDGAAHVRIWIDAGDGDPWLGRMELLHEVLEGRHVEHLWKVWPGEHESEYWTAHVADYLVVYSQALRGEDGPPDSLAAPPDTTGCKP